MRITPLQLNKYRSPHWDRLYGFQKIGVEFLKQRRSALLADEVGVGKTAQALIAADELRAVNILVICTASIKYDWKLRAIDWGFKKEDIHVVTTDTINQLKNKTGMFIINYDLCWRKPAEKILATKNYTVLICDESHYLKNRDAKRTKAVFGVGGYASKSQYRWLMTGTPILNRPEELYTTLRAMCPERLGVYFDYIQFTMRYCGGKDGNWGWDASGATNIKELSSKLEGFMLRRERDVLPDLPEKIMVKVHIPRTKTIDAIIYAENSAETDEELLSVRKRMGYAKVKDSAAYIRELLDSEEKIVVFAYHHIVIDELMKELDKFKPTKIIGGTPAKIRQSNIQKFIKDKKCRVFIGQIDAAGTGIDGLQGVCNHAVFVEFSYVPGVNQQAMGRIHRNGQERKTVFDFLIVEDSMDENILDKNLFKSEVVQSLMKDENKIFDFTQPKGEVPMKTILYLQLDVPMGKVNAEDLVKSIMAIPNVTVLSAELSTIITGEPSTEIKTPRGRGKNKKSDAPAPVEPPPVAPPVGMPPVAPVAPPVAPVAPPVAPPVVPVAPPVVPVAPPVAPVVTLSYVDFIKGAAGKIQTEKKTPAEVNAALAGLNAKLAAAFPQTPNVLVILDPTEQQQVRDIVAEYMASVGL